MSDQKNMSYTSEYEIQEASQENSEQFRQFIYRLLPFWPLLILAVIGGLAAGYLLLRYATPVYQSKTRVVVNDDTQEKSANLQSIINIDTRNLSAEAEKEMEILHSKDLLKKVASALQLNVQFYQKGNIKSGEAYGNTPYKVELEYPDSVKYPISGEVNLVNNQISFSGVLFPLDSFTNTRYGKIKWSLNPKYRSTAKQEKWTLSIIPTAARARQLKGALSIAPISKQSSILDLTFTDLFPDRSVAVLNSLLDVYGKSTVDYKSRIYANTQRFLEGRLNLVSDELNGVEAKLQAYKTKEHIVDLSTEGSLYLNKLKQADTKIGEIDVQMDVLDAIGVYVNQRNKTNSQVPATLGITDPVLTALLNQLYQSEFELEKIKQLSGDKNPQVEVLEQVIAKLRPSILSSINNLKLSMEASRKRLQADNESLGAFINRIPLKERLLLDISREQGIKNAIYTYLLQKREESAIAAASVVPDYRVIERPEFMGMVSPNRQNYYLISVAAALFLLALYIYFREFSNNRILFKTQIERSLSIPVIGELIYKPNQSGSPIVVGEGKRTLIAEQFRELRTNLNYLGSASEGNCKVILITSSIPSEGKSFVAINTSVSLCLAGAKVLLMEFDLRKPKISKPLGISREPGITNYLIGNAGEADILKQHPTIPNFYISPSGPVPPNPAELIGTARLKELISSLKLQFDYIVIDSPPIASVTDAKLLAVFADFTLYILRYNFTNRGFLKLINETYQRKTIPNMNLVFNGIENKRVLGYGKGYGYGYSYGYGYGYTTDEDLPASWWNKLFRKG